MAGRASDAADHALTYACQSCPAQEKTSLMLETHARPRAKTDRRHLGAPDCLRSGLLPDRAGPWQRYGNGMLHEERGCVGCRRALPVASVVFRRGLCPPCYARAWRRNRRARDWCAGCLERDALVLLVRRVQGRSVTLCANCSARLGPKPSVAAVAALGANLAPSGRRWLDRRGLRDRRVWAEAVPGAVADRRIGPRRGAGDELGTTTRRAIAGR